MIERIRRKVEQYLAEAGRRDFDARRFFCLDDSRGPIQGCFLLFFGADDAAPLLVAKGSPTARARMREGRSVYEIEFENLTTLERIGMNRGAPTIPAPLAMWNDDEVIITLQAALPGRLLKNISGRELFAAERVVPTLGAVVAWWRRFQDAFEVERRRVSEPVYREEIEEPIQRFRRRFVVDADQGRFLDRRFGVERRLLGIELPFMAAHGDFCTANVMQNDGSISVFDWEFPLRRQLPLFDIFHFFSSTRFPFRGMRGESSHFASFKATFWGDTYYGRAVRSAVLGICRDYEISAEAMQDLFVLSLVHIANLKFDALVEVFGIDERGGVDDVRGLWRRFGADKDVPFACIQDGVSENLRFVVRQGFPDWFGDSSPSR